jgi:small subunit ribosomal protein S16
MLRIRLARGGTNRRPHYSIVIADQRAPRDGRFIEKIGTLNPIQRDETKRVVLDVERAKHWLSVGAQPTDRLARLLDGAGVLKRETRSNPKKMLPKKKAQERATAKAAKAAAAAAGETKAE